MGINETKIPWDTVTPMGTIETGTVNKWIVDGLHKHPFHLHSISYQLGGVVDPTGFFQSGDWHDVIKLPHDPYVRSEAIYFSAVAIGLKSVVHCHFLSHEDTGCMGYFRTIGNPDARTGLHGRPMKCTGDTTGKSHFDISLCTYVSTSESATYLESSYMTYALYTVLGSITLLVSHMALKHFHTVDTYVDKSHKESSAEMETIMLTSMDMDYSSRNFIDCDSCSNI